MKTIERQIIETLENLVHNLDLQLMFPEITTFDKEREFHDLQLKEKMTRKELSALKSQLKGKRYISSATNDNPFGAELIEVKDEEQPITEYLNECIEKATPNLSKIKDVDNELAEIRGEQLITDEEIEKEMDRRGIIASWDRINGRTMAKWALSLKAQPEIDINTPFFGNTGAKIPVKAQPGDVTMHDLRVDDLAREEMKMYDCICKVCKGKFKSSVADMDICPSCYV